MYALRDDDEVYVHSICPENGKAIVTFGMLMILPFIDI